MTFATVNDITLHYQIAGSGDIPLVFVNSLGTNMHCWAEVATQFPYTVRYDKRGHGLSDAPPAPYTIREHSDDLRGLLDNLAIDRAVLVGVSVGGMIALDFAAQFPERVMAMVLCDTAGKIGDVDGWNVRIDLLQREGMSALADGIGEVWFAPMTREGMVGIGRNTLTRTPLEGYIGTCAALRDADLRSTLVALDIPTLVLCGEYDVATPPDLVRGLADALPNATFQLIPDAGHQPGWEQPAATTAAIKQFLQSLPRDKFAMGMRVRRAVLGDVHVDRSTANSTDFDADFQRFITEFAWGTVWASDTLDRKTRHLITLAILAALGKEHEFAMHVQATRNTGVSADELKEALHHVAIYAGVPAANSAIGIAKRILNDGVNQ